MFALSWGDTPLDRMAGQGQVSDQVEQAMTHRLTRHAHSAEHPVPHKQRRGVRGDALKEITPRDVAEGPSRHSPHIPAETAGWRDLAHERLGGDGPRPIDRSDMRQLDMPRDMQARAGFDPEMPPAIRHRDTPQHPDRPAGLRLLAPTCGGDRFAPGRGAAVEDRQFVGVDLRQHVVDPEGAERRHQMLDGADEDAITPKRRGKGLRFAVSPKGGNIDDTPVRQSAAKDDAVIGRRRADPDRGVPTGMQARSGSLERERQRGLEPRGRGGSVEVEAWNRQVVMHRNRPLRL